MKRIASFFMFLFLFTSAASANILLTENGRSVYTIIIGKNASLPEKFAAEELQKYLKEISGVNIPIKKAGEGKYKEMILIGTPASNPLIRKLDKGISFSSQEEELDAFQIKTGRGNLLLTGSNPRASLYAVYDFLEDELGVFWPSVFSEEEIVPRRKKITLKNINRRESASFKYRGYVYLTPIVVMDWMAKHKMNFGRIYVKSCDRPYYWNKILPEMKKRGITALIGFHGFHQFLPPNKYFKEHPEYYSAKTKTKSGFTYTKKERVPTQFCTSNKEALKIYTDNFLALMGRHPEIDIFCVCQADGYGWCECPLCGNEKWEVISRFQRASDRLLNVVNSVAKEAKEKFPDKKILYLGYVSTGPVPKRAKPLPNVIYMLAPFESSSRDIANHSGKYHSCPDIIAYYRRLIKNWTKLVPEVLIYEYYCGRSSDRARPRVNTVAIKNSLKYFADHNVKGLISQGGYNWWRPFLVNHYLFAELLWNVNADVDTLLRNFCQRRYGNAAEAMLQYFKNFEKGSFSECELNLKKAKRLAENPQIVNLIRHQQIFYGWAQMYARTIKYYGEIPKLMKAGNRDKAEEMYRKMLILEKETLEYLKKTKIRRVIKAPYSFSKLLKARYGLGSDQR